MAFVGGAVAAILWLERRTTSSAPESPAPKRPPPTSPRPEPEPAIEQAPVPDLEQAARIAALEAELSEQRALRTPEPTEPHPGVDAIRAARARTFELERQLVATTDDAVAGWADAEPSAPEELIDAVAEHLPRISWLADIDVPEIELVWPVLGAMQEFAESCGGDWFEFDGDFARWCAESGHPDALPGDVCEIDPERPTFQVPERVNRSGVLVVLTFVRVGGQRLYYVDDVGGETGRMHVVGVR